MNIKKGTKVWWEDPNQHDPTSFTGIVREIIGNIYYIDELDQDRYLTGLGAEAYANELIILEDGFECPFCYDYCYEKKRCPEFNAKIEKILENRTE
jgi:hypothetical protein